MKDQSPSENEVEYIRMRTKHMTELIITSHQEFTICCIQDCDPAPKVEEVAKEGEKEEQKD